jgi:hypothetical protein
MRFKWCGLEVVCTIVYNSVQTILIVNSVQTILIALVILPKSTLYTYFISLRVAESYSFGAQSKLSPYNSVYFYSASFASTS